MSTWQKLIKDSLVLCGRCAENEIPSGHKLNTAITELNDLLGEWEGEDVGLWNEIKYKFCLTPGKPSYTIGDGGDIDINHPLEIVEMRTKIISGAVTYKGTSTIAAFLALTTGTEGDYYQFTDSNDDINIDDYGVLANDITALITDSDYTIVDDSGTYIQLSEKMENDFVDLPSKQSQGTPVIFHYSPGTDTGTLELWRTGIDGSQIFFTSYEGWEEVTTSNITEAINFPKSWRSALRYSLAVAIGITAGTPSEKLDKLKMQSTAKLEKVINSNATKGSITFHVG